MGSDSVAVFVGRLLAAGPARRDGGSVNGGGMVKRARGGAIWKTGHSRVAVIWLALKKV
jgi:hypothetical protein